VAEKRPSIELSQDLAEFGDNPGAAYEDDEPLDLGKHGEQDPLAPLSERQ
jgi:hypothetical protein